MSQTLKDQNYRSALGLKRDPFAPEPDAKFYYPFDSYEQRLKVLDHLVQGTDLMVLVIGEYGSGKTSLLHRYLATAEGHWKTDRIQTDGLSLADKSGSSPKSDGYPVFVQQDTRDPIVIIDDAHKLPENDLIFLLRDALIPGSSRKIKRLVLFGEPSLSKFISALSESTATETAINKISMPVLTRDEVESYLQYRPALAGHTGESLFKSSVADMIHKKSEGLPGGVNQHADEWLRKKYAPNSKKEGMATLLKKLPFKALGWSLAVIVAVVIGILVLNWPGSTRRTLPDTKQASIRVFRAKIPALADSDTLKLVDRVAPRARASTAHESVDSEQPSPAVDQPATLAKVVPQPVEPPPIIPAAPKKVAVKN
ncbi:MAG: hypothetical protein P8X85_20180, partial [Desulfobacterales bacterium]